MGTKKYLLFWEIQHRGYLRDSTESSLVQVVGEYVEITNRFRTFIHYEKEYDSWFIGELRTGVTFAEGLTREDAINDARQSINMIGEREGEIEFLKWILRVVRRKGRIPKPYIYQEED